MLDKAEAKEIAMKYSKEVVRALRPEKIILFGSYVNGIPHVESDIDIGVFMRGLDDTTWYNTRILLQNLRFNKQFVAIEPHLLDETNDPSGFALHVAQNGEILYQ